MRRQFFPTRNPRRAVTLLELMVSVTIIGLVALAFSGALVYSVRAIQSNRMVSEALQVAQYYEGLVASASFQNLGIPGLPTGAWERQFEAPITHTIQDTGRPRTYTVSFRITGWADVDSTTNNGVTVTFPDNAEEWVANEWVGQYAVVTRGRGAGQIVRVVSNTANTLTITRDLTGATQSGWDVIPNTTSRIYLNNGKTVLITVSWNGPRGVETFRRSILIPRPEQRRLS